MVFPGVETVHLSEVAPDVPAIVMRGISKELPWPGSRCGWIEVLNRSARPELLRLRRFAGRRQAAGGLLHQRAAAGRAARLRRPALCRPPGRARARVRGAGRRGLRGPRAVPGLKVNPAQGAFYMTALFEPGVLNGNNRLPIANPELQRDSRAAVRRAAPRRPLRLPLAGLHGHLRGAADRLLLAASRLPLHPARDRRRQAGLDLPYAGGGGHGVHRERPQLGRAAYLPLRLRVGSALSARAIASPPAARKSLRDSSQGSYAALPFMSLERGAYLYNSSRSFLYIRSGEPVRGRGGRTPLAARRRSLPTLLGSARPSRPPLPVSSSGPSRPCRRWTSRT